MEKTFNYFKKTGEIFDRDGEWDGDEGYDFEYTVDEEDLLDAVSELLYDDFFTKTTMTDGSSYFRCVSKGLKKLISDFGLLDMFADAYEEDLKEYFEEEALDSLNNGD